MRSRIVCAAIAGVLLMLALTVLRPPQSAGGGTRDFQAYLAAGRARDAGTDPYGMQIVRYEPAIARIPGAMLPFVGTPASLPWWSLLARMPDAAARAMWETIVVAAFFALALASARLAGATSAFDLACALLVTAAFAPADGAVALGQSAIVAAAAATLAAAYDRPVAISALSFVALVLQPNVAIAVLASLRRRGAALAVCAAALAVLLLGANRAFAYVAILRAHAAAEFGSLLQVTPSSLGVPVALAVLLGCFAVATTLYAMRGSPRAAYAAGCCALPFVVGFFHVHDFAVVSAAAIWCIRRAPGALFGPALLATTAVGSNLLDAASSGAIAQDTVLALALVAAICATRPGLDRSAFAWIAASLGLVAGGLWFAARDRLPVWPDAMQPFHAAFAGTAAQWHAELLRAGFFAYDAGSVALRAIPLAGCAALLWIAMRTSNVDLADRVER